MLRFYYSPKYKYTNRYIVDVSSDTNYVDIDYVNIDSPDTINGHIIYTLGKNETFANLPTYIVDQSTNRRYFVTGLTQLNSKKYQISLLRDIISESPDTWKYEQAYISSGLATNYNKYKKWNLPFTNTKINEQRLNINGKSSFFVYYVNEQHINNDIITENDLNVKYTIPSIINYDYTVDTLSDIPSYEYIGQGELRNITSYELTIKTNMSQGRILWKDTNGTINTNPDRENYSGDPSTWDGIFMRGTDYNLVRNNYSGSLTNFQTAVNNWYNSNKNTLVQDQIPSNAVSNLSNYIGKTILDNTTHKIYLLRCIGSNKIFSSNVSIPNSATLRTAMSNITWPMVQGGTNTYDVNTRHTFLSYVIRTQTYTYTLEEVGTASSFDFAFKGNVRKLPRSAVRCVNIVSDDNHNDEELAQCLMLAQTNGINEDNTTGRILDIQYLPFSIATSTNTNFKINNDNLIAQFLDLDDYYYHNDLTDLTNINKETDTIKIVSPSRASQYLFSPYNNNGNMVFDTKITLKPYASVIYVRPSTQGLLIYDWDDKDCLIIQEDFSLTNVTSQWTQYIYNNKNYSSIFERQMQGRELERSWEKRVEEANMAQEEWNAKNITAERARAYSLNIPVISDLAAGMTYMFGNASADKNYMNAVQTDLAYNQAMYQEGVSLAQDMFKYQLDNIKSQPLIPSKISTLDGKVLDGIYLEFYSTNETELASIEKFYHYNGNRIDDYGTFDDYWGPFVRGKIIISLHYTQPEVEELNRRLNMGIFTGGIE